MKDEDRWASRDPDEVRAYYGRLVTRYQDTIERLTSRLAEAEQERQWAVTDRDHFVAENDSLTTQLTQAREAIDEALHELGVPDRSYPAPVANAVAILGAALQPPTQEKE